MSKQMVGDLGTILLDTMVSAVVCINQLAGRMADSNRIELQAGTDAMGMPNA